MHFAPRSLGIWVICNLFDQIMWLSQWLTSRQPSRGEVDVSGWQANPVLQSWLMKNWKKRLMKLNWYDFARPECTWSSQPPQVPRGLADSTPLMHVCACVMVVRARTIPKERKFILDGSARRWLIQRLELISLATRELITSTNSHELLTTTSILGGLICHKLKAEIKEGKSNETLLMQCWGQTLY